MTDDPIVAHATVIYRIPLRSSEVFAWSTPGLVEDDPEDDHWIEEVEEAVKDRLPDLLDRSDEPYVEVD